MRVYLAALGCKLNQAELESLGRRFEAAGHRVVTDAARADWAIVNTCTVTHVAARKSRGVIRRLQRGNPHLRLAVIGCYAEMSPEEIARLPGVALVLPNAQKDDIVPRILAEAVPAGSASEQRATEPRPRAGGHTRAFVKVQDGCDNHCTYCVVTIARGPSRSRPLADVLREIKTRVDEGHREIVLTGINIGAYGRDRVGQDGAGSLAGLVEAILQRTALRRLRLSSIEPWDLTDELLACWEDPRLCPHLHLPLQSGCDATLQRMGRRHATTGYAEAVRGVRNRLPEVALTTDLIVGFPGETDAEFAETLGFVEAAGFARLHVFRFSPREGTVAARMPGQVSPPVAQERSERLISLGRAMSLAYHARFLGRDVEVLFEAADGEGGTRRWNGLTPHYVRAFADANEELRNELRVGRCVAVDEAGLEVELT